MEEKQLTIFGVPEENAVAQIRNVLKDERAISGALMADNHLGYSMPIGGVVAYDNAISPTGVGFDIACGNMCVKTNLTFQEITGLEVPGEFPEAQYAALKRIMREIQKQVEFGLGGRNETPIDHDLYQDEAWEVIDVLDPKLKDKARAQLGTVGSGNHYVDLLIERDGTLWIANHFGSRGLGHTIASGFMSLAAGKLFSERVPETEDAVVLNADSPLGESYIAAMKLAGEYAYAGREHVISQVLRILGAEPVFEVHNHHNFAWEEDGKWIVRKGATPLTTKPSFIGGSMGDVSVIVRGISIEVPSFLPHLKEAENTVINLGNLGSAPHGAGRVMSRTKAAGKMRKAWFCGNRNCSFKPVRSVPNEGSGYEGNKCPECGLPLRKGRVRLEAGLIDWDAVRQDLMNKGICVLGAGADESPGVYKDLPTVLAAHENIEILHTLHPIGVVMASPDTYDPYRD